MKTYKDIDFTKVDYITYALEEYLHDIDVFEVVSHCIHLNKIKDNIYEGHYFLHDVYVNTLRNTILFDNTYLNVEEFIHRIYGDDVDPSIIILKITGISLDEYIESVTYLDGSEEYLDIRCKLKFMNKGVKRKYDR